MMVRKQLRDQAALPHGNSPHYIWMEGWVSTRTILDTVMIMGNNRCLYLHCFTGIKVDGHYDDVVSLFAVMQFLLS
jgi:hypothetical protein